MTDVTNIVNSLTRGLAENCTQVITSSSEGGAQAKTLYISTEVLTGTAGYRAGALAVSLNRASDQQFAAAWDGNPDCAIKATTTNLGNGLDGVTPIGGVRVLDIQARNRGTNIAWVKAVEINGRNDSGKTATSLCVVHIRAEQYGTITDTCVGIDVEMANEGTVSGSSTGILVRNNEQSGVAAVTNVFEITHTANSNGFTNLFKFGADAAHDTVGQAAVNGNQSRYLTVMAGSTPYYIPLYDGHA